VLFLPTFGDRWFLTRDGSAGKPVNVSMPETYASAGPTLDDRG
jgi:hypothetical protein